MKKKYEEVINPLEIEDDNTYEAICLFEEYCEQKNIPPMSFKVQLNYLLQLHNSDDIKRAVETTILKSWSSITYAVDNINSSSKSFTDTSKSTFVPKKV